MVKIFKKRVSKEAIIPENILEWENKIVTKELLLHFFSKVRSRAQIYNYEYWFAEIFLNSLRNLVPFLEIYPVNYNESSKIIERDIALGNGLNEWELEILNDDQFKENVSIKNSNNETFEKCWSIEKKHDSNSLHILGIKFKHPNGNDISLSYYEFCLKIKLGNECLTLDKNDYERLIDLIKIIFLASYSVFETEI